jgi:flap endonuclease-1
MGIKDLCQFLKKVCPSVFINLPINSLSGQRIAIDTSVYLYKFICINNQHKGNWIDMFIHMILWLKHNNIRPIFVFDGKPPKEKEKTQKDRRENRGKLKSLIEELTDLIEIIGDMDQINTNDENLYNRLFKILNTDISKLSKKFILYELNNIYKKENSKFINIGQTEIQTIQELLTYWGIPWFQANGEAERTCSWLCRSGWVKGVLTTDSDVLAYGCPVFIQDLKINDPLCKIVRYEDILQVLDLKEEEFIDFCILCGTDYNNRLPGIGPNTAYDLILKYKKIENIPNINRDNLCYETVRNLFKLPDKDDVEKVLILDYVNKFKMPYFKEPDKGNLTMFLFKHNSKFNIADFEQGFKPNFVILD